MEILNDLTTSRDIKKTNVNQNPQILIKKTIKKPTINYQLNDTWVLWFHDLNNNSWTFDSYIKIFSFDTVDDFWILYNNLNNIYNGMYYLMREGYPPMWDHDKNINGAGWTYKVDKIYANEFWEKLSCFCIGETISTKSKDVIGISISPKIKYVSIRIWVNNCTKEISDFNYIKKETANDSFTIAIENARFTPNKDAHK